MKTRKNTETNLEVLRIFPWVSVSFLRVFSGCLLLFILAASAAYAHDPGLSYVTLEERSNGLAVTATFSDTEVASLDLSHAIEISRSKGHK